jgi:hypothetical protein
MPPSLAPDGSKPASTPAANACRHARSARGTASDAQAEMVDCALTCLDCAACCALCVEMMCRDSSFSGAICGVCAEICDACGHLQPVRRRGDAGLRGHLQPVRRRGDAGLRGHLQPVRRRGDAGLRGRLPAVRRGVQAHRRMKNQRIFSRLGPRGNSWTFSIDVAEATMHSVCRSGWRLPPALVGAPGEEADAITAARVTAQVAALHVRLGHQVQPVVHLQPCGARSRLR